MLLFGGATLQDTGYTPLDLNDMWLYSAESNAWTMLMDNCDTKTDDCGSRPPARKSAAGAVYDGYFYIAGGYKNSVSNNVQTDFWRYDIKHNQWEAICGFPADDDTKACPTDGDGHASVRDQGTMSVVLDGTATPSAITKLVLFGGFYLNSLIPYSDKSNTWIFDPAKFTGTNGGVVTDPKAQPPTFGPWEYVPNLKGYLKIISPTATPTAAPTAAPTGSADDANAYNEYKCDQAPGRARHSAVVSSGSLLGLGSSLSVAYVYGGFVEDAGNKACSALLSLSFGMDTRGNVGICIHAIANHEGQDELGDGYERMDHSMWTMPDPVSTSGSETARYGGSIYIYGGTTQNNNELSPTYCSTEGNLLRLHFTIPAFNPIAGSTRIDPVSLSYTNGTNMPGNRTGAMVAPLGDMLHLFGGLDGKSCAVTFNDLWRFPLTLMNIHPPPVDPSVCLDASYFDRIETSGRAGAAVIPHLSYDDTSTSVGGLLSNGRPKLTPLLARSAMSLLPTALVTPNGVKRVHEPAGNAPTPAGFRWLHSGARVASDGSVVVHGGLDGVDQVLSDTWMLNQTESNVWIRIDSATPNATQAAPPPLYGHCMASGDNYIVSVGGSDTYREDTPISPGRRVTTAGVDSPLGKILMVLVDRGWYVGYPSGSEPDRRFGHACAVVGDPITARVPMGEAPRKLFVSGGENAAGQYLSDLWELDLPRNIVAAGYSWSWKQLHPVKPSPPGLKWHQISLMEEPTGGLALVAFGGEKQVPGTGARAGENLVVSRTECEDLDLYGCLWLLHMMDADGTLAVTENTPWRRASFQFPNPMHMGSRFMHAMVANGNYSRAVIYGGYEAPSPADTEFGVDSVTVATGVPSFLSLGSNDTNTSAACPGRWADLEYWKAHPITCSTASDCSNWLTTKSGCNPDQYPQCQTNRVSQPQGCVCANEIGTVGSFCDWDSAAPSPSPPRPMSDQETWYYGVGFLVLVIIGLLARIVYRKYKKGSTEAKVDELLGDYHRDQGGGGGEYHSMEGGMEDMRIRTMGDHSPTSSDPDRVVQRLGRGDSNLIVNKKDVEILREIAHGSAGVVSLGKWNRTYVAVKKHFPNDQESYDNFCVEAQIHAQLHHPNIVQLLGICQSGRELLTLTEFMTRGSLFSKLRELKQLSPSQMIKFAMDAAQGMNYLHSVQILHRDLKSLNLLVDEHWNVKVADFGTSRKAANTMTQCAGTALWMAPEVVRGKIYTNKADVYSFGIIMWENLTCQTPFNDKNNVFEIMSDVEAGARPMIPHNEAPKEYVSLMQACWAGEPTKRPDFDTVLDVLEKEWDWINVEYKEPLIASPSLKPPGAGAKKKAAAKGWGYG